MMKFTWFDIKYSAKYIIIILLAALLLGAMHGGRGRSLRLSNTLNVAGITTLTGAQTLTGVTTHGSNVISDTDGTDDLGTTTVRWDQIYADELFANKGADVASAASSFALGADGNFFDITGTTGIDSVAAQTVGKRVVLQFDGALTMTDGGNLKLEGNFVTAAGATIMLESDGTDWYEVSRAGGNINIAGTSTLTGAQTLTGQTTHGGNVISDTDGTDDLGTSSVFWSAIYADQAIFQKGADVASAASSFTLGTDGTLFDITGTTGIDSIASSTTGRIVILQFDSTPTVTDGGNLKLAGNLVATADDVLVLVAIGSDWFEMSRSVN